MYWISGEGREAEAAKQAKWDTRGKRVLNLLNLSISTWKYTIKCPAFQGDSESRPIASGPD